MTPGRCRKVADMYRQFPPKTRVDMINPCGCAAGIIGKQIKGNDTPFRKGAHKILSILAGRNIGKMPDSCIALMPDDVANRMYAYLEYYFLLFGADLTAYGRPDDCRTTTGWLARWWDFLADMMEKKGGRK